MSPKGFWIRVLQMCSRLGSDHCPDWVLEAGFHQFVAAPKHGMDNLLGTLNLWFGESAPVAG